MTFSPITECGGEKNREEKKTTQCSAMSSVTLRHFWHVSVVNSFYVARKYNILLHHVRKCHISSLLLISNLQKHLVGAWQKICH